MSTVRERINVLPRQTASPCRNIMYIDPLHGRQIFLDGLRHRRECKSRNTYNEKLRNYIELTLVVAGSFALFGLLFWVCT